MQEGSRYSRQSQVKQFGAQGQQSLSKSHVLVVGMGGLGCQLSAQLAGAGVGKITIIDHDLVSVSNLHRQILFRESDVGQPKALAAQRELQNLNSEITISAHTNRLSPSNVSQLTGAVDVVVDAADNFCCSYLLSDACDTHKVPLISASVNATFGYLGVFCASQINTAPSFRAVFPRMPNQTKSCDTVGVTGPSVGIVASLQAQETLKVLLNDPHQLAGQLLYIDLWNYNQHKMDVSKASIPELTQTELIEESQLDKMDFVIDVRSHHELKLSTQPFKIHYHAPLPELMDHITAFPSDQRIVLACQTGQRALLAAQHLSDQNFTHLAAILPSNTRTS